jgi:DNA-binding CsgD family transcriptional regulator
MDPVPVLAGRVAELRTVADALSGRGASALLIVGEAGVGKSRLVAAAAAAVAEVGVVSGWCLPSSGALPLVAVIDVLRGLTAVEDGQLFKAVLAESPSFVRGELARLLPELDEPQEDTEGPGGWDDWRRQRLFDALRQTLAASSQLRPVAVVIEDLHWADPSTLDLIDYLLARGHGTGVPLVLTYRAEDEDTDPAGGEWLTRAVRNDRVHRLDLGALTRAETAEQIDLLMGQQPTTSLVEEIYARSEGNPFFTDQLVAALASTDAPPTLPGGLRGLLLDRIGHVEEAQRQVLAALAIAERGLDEPALTRVCGTPRDVVRDSLRDLAARRLLRRPDAAGRHSLRHALLGDVVADILLPSERAEMHRRIARLLSGWNEPELAADIAEHYAGAGLTAEELRWRVAAGQRADAVYASAEAARHWLRAVRLSESLSADDRVDGLSLAQMYGAAVDALAAAGSEETAHALSEEALDRLGDTDDENAAEVLRRAGQMRGISEPSRGLELLGRALAIYDRRPPSADQVRTLRDMLDILANDGRQEEAAAALARALHLAAQAELRDFGLELGAIGASHDLLAAGRSDEALQQIRDISRQLTPDDDAELHLRVAIMHTAILCDCGLEHEVEAVAAPALQIAADRGMAHSYLPALLRGNSFESMVDVGRVDAAARLIDPVSQDEPGVSARVDYEARAYLEMLRGNIGDARRRWTELHALAPQPLAWRAGAFRWEAETSLWDGDADAAANESLALLSEILEATDGALTGNALLPVAGGLLSAAVRSCADLADQARAVRDPEALHRAEQQAAAVNTAYHEMVPDPFAPGPLRPLAPGSAATWQAEWSRLRGGSDSYLWGRAAAAWDAMSHPHRAAYAYYRQAEALLSRPGGKKPGAALLRAAAERAAHHVPLRRAIQGMAQHAGVDLTRRSESEVSREQAPSQPFGLTDRELAVLQLLAKGKTNSEIGAALFISRKTASVHVTNILRKLEVASRVQAATVAQRNGLLEPSGTAPRS